MGAAGADADLDLLGAGVSFPDHLTVQTIEMLSICEQTYGLPAERAA
jgi:hypothetical protein